MVVPAQFAVAAFGYLGRVARKRDLSGEMAMSHPYASMGPEAFWRTAVADRNPFDIESLYRKKFSISAEDKIATAGSCFAQHIGHRLKGSGFRYVDLEPGPSLLAEATRRTFGYGVYSARYGNIYTTRQLLQLYLRAYGQFSPADDVWLRDGQYMDAFRPAMEPDGFGSLRELEAARAYTNFAVRRILERCQVFVFTLGLTEAWYSKVDGAVYPACPGVEAGEFDPGRYGFANFTHAEVKADLLEFISLVRKRNPAMKFILTVSPVPLTATASGEHVLVATTYSKATLRSVAGEVADNDALVDYFPSYEIITGSPMRSMFFEPNLRSVNAAGVDLVMRHFFEQHGRVGEPPGEVRAKKVNLSPDDVACDEGRLERWVSP